MASSVSSPFKPADDELKLDELVSELHALKQLYGLLQNSSDRPARHDRPTANVLDEKSRHLLKKLLDGATQQALQSQAKIISCTPETPKWQAQPNSNPSNNDLQKEVRETKNNQECHPILMPPENLPEAAKTTPLAQTKITQSPCPIPEPTRHKHRRSKDATVHRSRANDLVCPDRSIGESGSRRMSSQLFKNGSCRVLSIRNGGSDHPPSSEKGGEILAMVPVQKRARVEPVDIPSRITNQTQKKDQDDRVLTHRKRIIQKQMDAEPSSIRSMRRTSSSKRPSSTSLIPTGDQMAQIVQRNDQLAQCKTQVTSNKNKQPGPPNRSKAKTFSSSSKESAESNSDSTCSTRSIALDLQKRHRRIKTRKKTGPVPQPLQPTLSNHKARRSPCRRHVSLRLPTTPIVQGNDQPAETKNRAFKPPKQARSTRSTARRYSSSSSASKRSNSVSNWSTRPDLWTLSKQSRGKTRGRRRVTQPPSTTSPILHHRVVPQCKLPPSRAVRTRREKKPEEKVDEQGRFKKLTNKLAIIFHHHHHHHHHLHDGEDRIGGGGGQKGHERSLWKYLKRVLHVKKGNGAGQGKKHRHNLRVLMEWFFHHLWWLREKPRTNVKRRRLAKKVKWWDWFRRRGGVVVGGRRRLRLGFNGSQRLAGVRKG